MVSHVVFVLSCSVLILVHARDSEKRNFDFFVCLGHVKKLTNKVDILLNFCSRVSTPRKPQTAPQSRKLHAIDPV